MGLPWFSLGLLALLSYTTVDCTQVKPSLCFLPYEPGPCKGTIKRYYYDAKEGKCMKFFYGGCDGNDNNFNTEKDCQHKCTDVCSLPKEVGPCEALIPAYYFDKMKGRCMEFQFGGCDANANNFQTMDQCKRRCPDVNVHCLEPEDRGEIVDYVVRWMFNAEKWECVPFVYGGAGGNNNKFETEQECMNYCPISDICQLPPDSGPCEAASPRWHYDAVSGSCKTFTYGGCLGNANRFDTMEACRLRCPEQNICGLPKMGEIPEVFGDEVKPAFLPRFYYDWKSGQCRYFEYDGKGGNENNFDTSERCRLYCPTKSRCAEPIDGGSGNSPHIQWYYDLEDRKCWYFVYYGTGGNGNRFKSERECQNMCVGCSEKKDPGPCHGYFTRWYYDSDAMTCKTFVYGGCRGSRNNFEKREECINRCL